MPLINKGQTDGRSTNKNRTNISKGQLLTKMCITSKYNLQETVLASSQKRNLHVSGVKLDREQTAAQLQTAKLRHMYMYICIPFQSRGE